MHLRLFGCLAILSALGALGALGCSGNKDQPDPTSHEALRKADPLEHGCAYVKQTQSSYGTASDSTNSNECTPGSCDELRAPASDTAYAGGETYNSSTTYVSKVDFVGTCQAQQPVRCDDLKAYGTDCDACLARTCCMPLFFCDKDPNCDAIIVCVNQCKGDGACQTQCVKNGDAYAAKNFRALLSCLSDPCSKACGR